jgi:hypothetical protein
MARSALRRVPWFWSRRPTRSRWRAHRSLVCWSCRSSASTVLELLQPVAGCCANETVLAMGQPVRAHDRTCSCCTAALGLRLSASLQVCRALRRLLPAVRRSHFSDHASCARISGAAQPRAVLPDRPSATFGTYLGALGVRAALGVLMRAVGAQQRLCVTDGHMCMASSRAPTAAGITDPCHVHA